MRLLSAHSTEHRGDDLPYQYDLSVIIPTTGRHTLERAVAAARSSGREAGLRTEIVVVDDRPRAMSQTMPLAMAVAASDAIRLVHTHSVGLASARNTGHGSK